MTTDPDKQAPRPERDAPADLSPYADGPPPAPDANPAADGTDDFVVLENPETGETHVAAERDVSNPHGEGFTQTATHPTPDGAERDAET